MIVAAGARTAAADPLKPTTTALGWDVDLDALLQVDAVPYAQSSVNDLDPGTGAPLNEESILVRRALLRARARRGNAFASAELESNDVAGPVTRLLGAVVGWSEPGRAAQPPLVTVMAGLFLIPFGAEVPTNLRDKPFLEVPAWANALFPGNYDGGVTARGAYGIARWTVAVTDGAPSGDAQWRGRDPLSTYDLIARVGGVVDATRTTCGMPRVEFGVSALTGKGIHPGAPPTKDTITWVDANGNGIVDPTEVIDVPGSPGEPAQFYTHDAIGADASLRWVLDGAGTGWAFAEGVVAKNLDRGVIYGDAIARGRDLRELGYSAGVVQDATARAQLGARYDRYDADRDAASQGGLMFVPTKQIFSTLSVFAAVRWTTTRLQLQYDHARNPLGLADNGLASTREDDRLTLRAQVTW